jgi:hypothetical protein
MTDSPAAEIVVLARPGGTFEARWQDRILCRSRQPFLDGARALLALGLPPETVLVMRHAGSDTEALRSTIGAASRLTVQENDKTGPALRRWNAFPRDRMRPYSDLNDEEASL